MNFVPREISAVTAMSRAEQDVAASAMRQDLAAALDAVRRVRAGRSVLSVAVEWPLLFAAYCRLLAAGGAHADQVARIFWPVDAMDVRDAPAKLETIFFSVCIARLVDATKASDFLGAETQATMASLLPPGGERRKRAFGVAVTRLLRAVLQEELPLSRQLPQLSLHPTMRSPSGGFPASVSGEWPTSGIVGRLAHRLTVHGHPDTAAQLFVASMIEADWPTWRGFGNYIKERPDILIACVKNVAAGRLCLTAGAIAHLEAWMAGKSSALVLDRGRPAP